jgi:1,5-anhydro-D-fructose reductase (1,5-anhydro-D-mannitol-forming)
MTVGWGIIGMGNIADKVTAPAMTEAKSSRLVAVMRRDLNRARELADEHGAARAYSTVEEVLEDDEVDAVYVATPVHVHAEQTIQAAEYGKHVLCEKPMALNPEEAQRMVDACDANGVKLMLCYYQRFNRRHQKIKELIASGQIGKVTAARVTFSGFGPDNPQSWRQKPEFSGGGNLMDCGSHCVDLLRYLLGDVTRVSALVSTIAFDYAVDDTATMLLEMDGGTHAVVSSHWSTLIPDQQESSVVAIYGTGGTIVSTPQQEKFSRGSLKLMTRTQQTEYHFEESTHVQMLDAFAASIESDEPIPITGQDGVAVSKVIAAAYQSAREGKAITIL